MKQISLSPESQPNAQQISSKCQNGEAGFAKTFTNDLSEAASYDRPTKSSVVELLPLADRVIAGSSNFRKRYLPAPTHNEEPNNKRLREFPSSSPKNQDSSAQQFPSTPSEPAVDFDKKTWQGFCDIESEPTYFSVMLREMGVQGVTVREVFAMDPAILETLPQPIYGLILLFRQREFGNEDQPSECPVNVWFANQLPAQNSCATLAMINILMNNTEVDTGEHLKQFKEFTQSFTPFQRGEALSSFDFVKQIHNSFAKKMDILEADKHLSYKVSKARREEQYKKEKGRRASVDSVETDNSAGHEENAHHFIAFLPVDNEIWKLDGMDTQPANLGAFDPNKGETWLSAVTDIITTIMAAGDDDYGVIAVTQSPLLSFRKTACININTITHVEARLHNINPDWKSFLATYEERPTAHTLGIEHQLPAHPVPDHLKAKADTEKTADLIDRRHRLIHELNRLADNIMTEIQIEAEEDQKAAERRYDLGPVIKEWLAMLAGNGFLEENLDRFMPKSKGGKAKR